MFDVPEWNTSSDNRFFHKAQAPLRCSKENKCNHDNHWDFASATCAVGPDTSDGWTKGFLHGDMIQAPESMLVFDSKMSNTQDFTGSRLVDLLSTGNSHKDGTVFSHDGDIELQPYQVAWLRLT